MRRPGPEEWACLLAEFENCGLTQKEFVARHDVSLSTFQYWLYKRSKRSSEFDVKPSTRFLPVEVVASPAPLARVEPEVVEAGLRSGVVVRFAVGTDTEYLAELLAAIG